MLDKEIKEELKQMLEDIKKDITTDKDLEAITKADNINLVAITTVLKNLRSKSLVESTSSLIRSYDEALAKCLDAGAKADDDFMYSFTVNYLNTVLSLVAHLFLVEDFAKNKDNLAFLKSKVRECLIYIDRL